MAAPASPSWRSPAPGFAHGPLVDSPALGRAAAFVAEPLAGSAGFRLSPGREVPSPYRRSWASASPPASSVLRPDSGPCPDRLQRVAEGGFAAESPPAASLGTLSTGSTDYDAVLLCCRDTIARQHHELEHERQRRQAELRAVDAELERERQQLAEAEAGLRAVGAELERERQQLAEAEGRLRVVATELERERAQRADAEARGVVSESKIVAAGIELERQRAETAGAEARLRALGQELDREHAARAEAEARHRARGLELEREQVQRTEAQARLWAEQAELEREQTLRANAEARASGLERQVADSEDRLAQLRGSEEEKCEYLERVRAECIQKGQELFAKDLRISELESALRRAELSAAAAHQEAMADQSCAGLEAQRTELQDRVVQLTMYLDSMRDELERARAMLRAERECYQARLAVADEQLRRLAGELATCRARERSQAWEAALPVQEPSPLQHQVPQHTQSQLRMHSSELQRSPSPPHSPQLLHLQPQPRLQPHGRAPARVLPEQQPMPDLVSQTVGQSEPCSRGHRQGQGPLRYELPSEWQGQPDLRMQQQVQPALQSMVQQRQADSLPEMQQHLQMPLQHQPQQPQQQFHRPVLQTAELQSNLEPLLEPGPQLPLRHQQPQLQPSIHPDSELEQQAQPHAEHLGHGRGLSQERDERPRGRRREDQLARSPSECLASSNVPLGLDTSSEVADVEALRHKYEHKIAKLQRRLLKREENEFKLKCILEKEVDVLRRCTRDLGNPSLGVASSPAGSANFEARRHRSRRCRGDCQCRYGEAAAYQESIMGSATRR